MQFNINNIVYVDQFSSNATLIQVPLEGQTIDLISQANIDAQNYPLSNRNGANLYVIPTDLDNVYVNFIPRKVLVTDTDIKNYLRNNFAYFVEPEVVAPELFTLPDGNIFRCVSESSVPLPKDQYTYYLMVNGIAKLIPNYITLEVLLAERNQSLLAVRILTERQCQDIPKQGEVPDKSGNWNSSMSDQTTNEVLQSLNANVQSGAAIAAGATAQANNQIAAVKAQAAADKAAAQQAQAEAQAATAASEAAIAQANATQAQAEAALAAINNS